MSKHGMLSFVSFPSSCVAKGHKNNTGLTSMMLLSADAQACWSLQIYRLVSFVAGMLLNKSQRFSARGWLLPVLHCVGLFDDATVCIGTVLFCIKDHYMVLSCPSVAHKFQKKREVVLPRLAEAESTQSQCVVLGRGSTT